MSISIKLMTLLINNFYLIKKFAFWQNPKFAIHT